MTENDDLPPIFSLEKVEFSFAGKLHTMSICNNYLALALDPQASRFLRIDLQEARSIEELKLPSIISISPPKIYMDADGKNCFIHQPGSIQRKESSCTYYVDEKWRLPILFSNIKGIDISSCTFLSNSTHSTVKLRSQKPKSQTQIFLFGTNDGNLYAGWMIGKERHMDSVWTVPNPPDPITGIYCNMLPDHMNTCLLILATRSRLFYWTGYIRNEEEILPVLETRTREYQKSYRKPNHIFDFLSKDDSQPFLSINSMKGISQLVTYEHSKIGWLASDNSIFLIDLDWTQNNGQNILGTVDRLILSKDDQSFDNEFGTILSIMLSKCHVLILDSKGKLHAWDMLSHECVYSENLVSTSFGRPIALVADHPISVSSTYWVHFEYGIYELKIHHEERFIWKEHLRLHRYANALELVTNDKDRDNVYFEQGMWKFQLGDHDGAGESFAQCSSIEKFEQAFLLFEDQAKEKNSWHSFKTFLATKFHQCSVNTNDFRDRVFISLVKIYLEILINHNDEEIYSELIREEFFFGLLEKEKKLVSKQSSKIKDAFFMANAKLHLKDPLSPTIDPPSWIFDHSKIESNDFYILALDLLYPRSRYIESSTISSFFLSCLFNTPDNSVLTELESYNDSDVLTLSIMLLFINSKNSIPWLEKYVDGLLRHSETEQSYPIVFINNDSLSDLSSEIQQLDEKIKELFSIHKQVISHSYESVNHLPSISEWIESLMAIHNESKDVFPHLI